VEVLGSEEELGLESRSLTHLCVSRIPVDNRRVVRPYFAVKTVFLAQTLSRIGGVRSGSTAESYLKLKYRFFLTLLVFFRNFGRASGANTRNKWSKTVEIHENCSLSMVTLTFFEHHVYI
jgi:hypothetical protein